jgi:signal transduction histidine kinase
LPAAVEVAAYRIVTEALTNVSRHSRARTCSVQLSVNGALEVAVCDDGRGVDPAQQPGVGITAMRERAAELGGWLRIEPLSPGTRVRARLPVAAQ